MQRHAFLWTARPVQALVEAWLIALLIMFGLYSLKGAQPQTPSTGLFFMCGAAGMVAVLRARMPAGTFLRRWAIETTIALMLGAGMMLLAFPARAGGLLPIWVPTGSPMAGAMLVLGCTGLGYLGCRVLAHAWLAWDRLRRCSLRWSLTHAHLALVLFVAAIGSLSIFVLFPPSRLTIMAQADARGLLASLVTRLLLTYFPALSVILILTALALAVVLPPAALFSYVVVRQTTRRLGALTAATACLRQGDYGARVVVTGEDELAQLQVDFNTMAETLQRTLTELQDERDRVAELLRTRRELVASVSHELRTPVATVRALLDPLVDRWDARAPSEARHDLEIIAGEVMRLQMLIDDLFTLSRLEVDRLTLQVAPFDVGQILRQLGEAMAPLAWQSGRVELVADVPAALPFARADCERLKQIVANLLRNAVRYTAPGGIVVIAAAADGDWLRLDVRDTGPGIASEDLPHLWDRFYRGRQAFPAAAAAFQPQDGAGLGLALVKELTEAMGGMVAVESVPGQGSCFTVRLPCAVSTG